MQNIEELYKQIPKDKRKDLRFMAKLLGMQTEKEIRKYAIEQWEVAQRIGETHKSEK